MSRAPQKFNNIEEIFSLWMYIVDAKRPGEGVGSMGTPADKEGGGSKIGKSCGHLLCMTPHNYIWVWVWP